MSKSLNGVPTLNDRASGILLHLTSLPSPHGVGDLGPAAFRFADFLQRAAQRWWQMLPIGPAGLGYSPYQAFSAFAGTPLLVSLDDLRKEGLLTKSDFLEDPGFSSKQVEYPRVLEFKERMLGLAFARFLKAPRDNKEFEVFVREQAYWLEDYSLFTALRQTQGGNPWTAWDEPLRRRDPSAMDQARHTLQEQVMHQKFVQFVFARQWNALKSYCRQKGIGLIGDLPIFVSLDSADVWAHPELFRLNPDGTPSVVAGVPPDLFSKTGQRWGNPLYNWTLLKERKYSWWVERFRRLFELFDVVRLDHFIGFRRFWEIPASEKTAMKGRYIPGPGADFFQEVLKQLPEASFIAEDLGVVIPEVTQLREQFHLPGMIVLQFAFSGNPRENPYLPHKAHRDSVIYTGTHDNDTTEGWFKFGATAKERRFARIYIGNAAGPIHWDMIRLAYSSVANTAILPMQDVLGLGSEARMNYPGRVEGNWQWRMEDKALTDELSATLRLHAATYDRI